jgi:hypothetical protein
MLYRCIRALLKVRSSSSIAGSFYATSINGSETLQATEVQAVEATKDKTLPPKISRPIGRDKAKRMKPSNTASNSTAFLQVLQNMRNRSASL